MWITKRHRVGNHDSGIAMLPERPLVGPTYTGHKAGQRGAFGRDGSMAPELTNYSAQERSGTNIADKADEVACAWVEKSEPRNRIMLRTGLTRVVADCFEAYHGGNSVATFLGTLRVDITAHLGALKIERLFIYKRDKAKGH